MEQAIYSYLAFNVSKYFVLFCINTTSSFSVCFRATRLDFRPLQKAFEAIQITSEKIFRSGISLLSKTLQNGKEFKSAKKILLPMTLSTVPQLFLINSGMWEQRSEIEIVDSRTLNNSLPQIKSEPDDDYDDDMKPPLSPSNKFQLIDSDTPLPEFSNFIHTYLQENNLSAVWGAFVDECANYYYQRYPNIQNSSEYQAIGRKMYQQYPAIKYEGKEPWSYFCKSLSQKIRHIKWKIKRKSLGLTTRTSRKPRESQYPDVKFRTFKRKVDRRYTPSKQYKALLRELSDGWTNESISESRISDILKSTSKGRRTWLASHAYRKMFSLIEEYPCFSDGKYVLNDFLYLLSKEDSSEMLQRLDSLFSAVGSLMEPLVENSSFLDKIKILKYMEQEVAFSRGRTIFTKSIIVHKKDIPEQEVMQHVQSIENSSPLLYIFTEGEELQKALVAGDKTIINTNTTVLSEALLILIATYYTFSIDYPRSFAQILGLLQSFVVGESYEGTKSNRCTAFMKRLTSNFNIGE